MVGRRSQSDFEDEIRALQDANRTDRTTLEQLAHPTPVLAHKGTHE